MFRPLNQLTKFDFSGTRFLPARAVQASGIGKNRSTDSPVRPEARIQTRRPAPATVLSPTPRRRLASSMTGSAVPRTAAVRTEPAGGLCRARSEHSPAIITPLRGAESEAPPWRGPTRHQAGDSGLKSTRRIRAARGITEQPTSRHAPPFRRFSARSFAILANTADLWLSASSISSKAIAETKCSKRSGFAVRNSIFSLSGCYNEAQE